MLRVIIYTSLQNRTTACWNLIETLQSPVGVFLSIWNDSMNHEHGDLYRKQHTPMQIESGVRDLSEAISTDLHCV